MFRIIRKNGSLGNAPTRSSRLKRCTGYPPPARRESRTQPRSGNLEEQQVLLRDRSQLSKGQEPGQESANRIPHSGWHGHSPDSVQREAQDRPRLEGPADAQKSCELHLLTLPFFSYSEGSIPPFLCQKRLSRAQPFLSCKIELCLENEWMEVRTCCSNCRGLCRN